MICPKWFWRYILEIADADFLCGKLLDGDRTRAFLKVMRYKCTYCTIPLARGISRSDELNNVLKNAYEIRSKISKKLYLPE
jgi:threonylcarbamoyladenosine tRNA methylthiotransferase MtaB